MIATAPPALAGDLVDALRPLKLATVREQAAEVLQTARTQPWEAEEVLRALLQAEIAARDVANRRMRLKQAGFPVLKNHSSYERNLADLPISGRQAVVDLRVRRFRCYQPDCPRKTFVEQVPVLAERYAHRTRRLRSLLEQIGLALGGRPASRHCTRSAIPTSRTTLLRMVRGLAERPITAAPRVLGVDEFAFRKGRRYGTILVDAAAHRVVDLLEDPTADALVDWLGKHPGTEIICRDCDGVYASAARRGAPEALQVADRWHLVHNLADALERFAVRVLALVRRELKAEEAASATSEIVPTVKAASLAPCRLKERTERRHAEIHELLEQGLTIPRYRDG